MPAAISNLQSLTWHLPISSDQHEVTFSLNLSLQKVQEAEKIAWNMSDISVNGTLYEEATPVAKGNYGKIFLLTSTNAPPLALKIIHPYSFIPADQIFYVYKDRLALKAALNLNESNGKLVPSIEMKEKYTEAFHFLAESSSYCYLFYTTKNRLINLSHLVREMPKVNKKGGATKYNTWLRKILLTRWEAANKIRTYIPTKLALKLQRARFNLSQSYQEITYTNHLSKVITKTSFANNFIQESKIHLIAKTPSFISSRRTEELTPLPNNKSFTSQLFFMVMQFYQRIPHALTYYSHTLGQEIRRPLTTAQRLFLLIQSAIALQEFTEKKLVHNDVKANNLIVTTANQKPLFLGDTIVTSTLDKLHEQYPISLQLIDFGFSREVGAEALTLPNACGYFPPELHTTNSLARLPKQIDDFARNGIPHLPAEMRTLLLNAVFYSHPPVILMANQAQPNQDIYSFGVMLWRVIYALPLHLPDQRAELEQLRVQIKPIVMQCCAIDPDARIDYPSLITQLVHLASKALEQEGEEEEMINTPAATKEEMVNTPAATEVVLLPKTPTPPPPATTEVVLLPKTPTPPPMESPKDRLAIVNRPEPHTPTGCCFSFLRFFSSNHDGAEPELLITDTTGTNSSNLTARVFYA